MAADNISALENFENDMNIITEKLNPYLDQVNIFSVLGLTNTEIRHSNMLAWLFDSKANHGLGNNFIKNFLEPKLKKEDKNKDKLSLYDFRVYRELEHIDLLLVSETEKFVIVIENKIWTKNHDNQLTRYSKFTEKYKNKDFSIYPFYLTPDGETPINEEGDISEWQPLSYKNIMDTLVSTKSTAKLKPESKLLINNYIDILRRDIMKDGNDKLIKICNDIYAQYKTVIDLINKYKTSNLVTVIKSVLFHYKDQNKIKFDNINNCKTTFKFYTPELDNLLPEFEAKQSSWNDTHKYDYELIIQQSSNDCQLRLNCALAGDHIDSATKDTMKKLISAAGKKKKEEFTYCIIGSKMQDIKDLSDENEMQTKVRQLIDDTLQWQNELLKELQK